MANDGGDARRVTTTTVARRWRSRSRPRSAPRERSELLARDDRDRRTGDRRSGRRLARLVTLARDHARRRRPRPRRARAGSRRGGRARRRHRRLRPASPASTASAIAWAGPRTAGLSDVSDREVGARAAAAPIIGRFSRSRSPPHPNTTTTRCRPPAIARAAEQRGASAVRGVGVVDEHRERLAGVDPLDPAGDHHRLRRARRQPRRGRSRSRARSRRGQRVLDVEATEQRERDGRTSRPRAGRAGRTRDPSASRCSRSAPRSASGGIDAERDDASSPRSRARAASSTPCGSSMFTTAAAVRDGVGTAAPWPRSTRSSVPW